MHSLVYLFYLVHLVHLKYIVHLDHYVRFLFCNGHEEASGGWAAMAGGSSFTRPLISLLSMISEISNITHISIISKIKFYLLITKQTCNEMHSFPGNSICIDDNPMYCREHVPIRQKTFPAFMKQTTITCWRTFISLCWALRLVWINNRQPS